VKDALKPCPLKRTFKGPVFSPGFGLLRAGWKVVLDSNLQAGMRLIQATRSANYSIAVAN
jgi:hypothetical protein